MPEASIQSSLARQGREAGNPFSDEAPLPSTQGDGQNMDTRILNLAGKQFGRLFVVSPAPRIANRTAWNCVCECGSKRIVRTQSLRNGETRSCGCLSSEIHARMCQSRLAEENRIHGESDKTPEYSCWLAIKGRCHNPRSTFYHYYGGRGIKVCERWRNSFVLFLVDMGRKPSSKHSIDRFPDNNGDYEPGNCRWATPKEQAANRRHYGSAAKPVEIQ